MSRFEDYAERFPNIAMERRDGILHLRLHTEEGPLVWGARPHADWPLAFAEIGADFDTRVIIMSGTGPAFCAELDAASFGGHGWDHTMWEGKRMLMNLLDIEIPIISAVNGPVTVHPEIPLMSDVVLASETARFADDPHFKGGLVPGDGSHVIWTTLLGPNRGRYFLFTEETLSAAQAHELGIVGEVLPPDDLLDRAWELAGRLATRPVPVLRNTRIATTRFLRKAFEDALGYGLALEGIAALQTQMEGDS
jgi:enoyl-CoA hydratase/carnithine racemase